MECESESRNKVRAPLNCIQFLRWHSWPNLRAFKILFYYIEITLAQIHWMASEAVLWEHEDTMRPHKEFSCSVHASFPIRSADTRESFSTTLSFSLREKHAFILGPVSVKSQISTVPGRFAIARLVHCSNIVGLVAHLSVTGNRWISMSVWQGWHMPTGRAPGDEVQEFDHMFWTNCNLGWCKIMYPLWERVWSLMSLQIAASMSEGKKADTYPVGNSIGCFSLT